MKNFILCLSLLFLTSCIPIDDFGAHWGKGTVDPAMIGKWQKGSGKDKSGVQVTQRKGTMKIDSLDKEERRKKDYAPLYARTLKAGPYTYLMARMRGAAARKAVKAATLSGTGSRAIRWPNTACPTTRWALS